MEHFPADCDKEHRQIFMSNWSIIRFIIIILCSGIIGGAIAFLGNQLGRFIGRKKLSVFKLRPRYTSMLITIITGMVIASMTLSIAILVSEPARVTMLRYREFKKEYEDLIQRLIKAREEDRQKINVYSYQDIILSAVVMPNPDKAKMIDELKALIAKTNEVAIDKSKKFAKKNDKTFNYPPDGRLVGYIPENLDAVAEKLRRATGEQVLFIRTQHNALLGSRILVVIANPIQNQLIFRKNEFITSATVTATTDKAEIWNELQKIILEKITPIAVSKGILPNPETYEVGEVESDYLADVVNKIKERHGQVTVSFYAREDTYILGPLKLEIKLKNRGE